MTHELTFCSADEGDEELAIPLSLSVVVEETPQKKLKRFALVCVSFHIAYHLGVKYPGGGDRGSGDGSPAVSWFRRRGCIPMACLLNRFMSSMLMSSS